MTQSVVAKFLADDRETLLEKQPTSNTMPGVLEAAM